MQLLILSVLLISLDTAAKLELPRTKAAPASIAESLELAGVIDLDPMRSQHVHARYPGVVREVMRTVGDKVRAGEALARVESSIGVQTFELTSSVSGVVLERAVASGQSIDSDVEAFTVADVDTLQARLIAYPRDLPKFGKGQAVSLRSSDRRTAAEGVVGYVSPFLDEHSRTAAALVIVDNRDGKWRVGQFVTGTFVIGKRDVAVAVPRGAVEIAERSREAEVFVLGKEGFERRKVRVGKTDEKSAEIVAGLSAGDEIVAEPVSRVVAKLVARGSNDD